MSGVSSCGCSRPRQPSVPISHCAVRPVRLSTIRRKPLFHRVRKSHRHFHLRAGTKETVMRGLWMGLAVISVIGLQAPALSEPAPAPAAKNSNEIVCERIEVIGARLGSKRVG